MPLLNVLAGDFRVDGVELGAIGRITENWQIQAGYAYLDGQVIKSAAGAAPVGSPLDEHAQARRHGLDDLRSWATGSRSAVAADMCLPNSRKTFRPIKTVPGFFAADVMGKYDDQRETVLAAQRQQCLRQVLL